MFYFIENASIFQSCSLVLSLDYKHDVYLKLNRVQSLFIKVLKNDCQGRQTNKQDPDEN